ncbi:MAG TPA: alpha/beta fold hydrolase, partial [Gemmatimonadales bacterium]|nr:alpha/beta fold hydrolase [Gemmatimonadales bacterium]
MSIVRQEQHTIVLAGHTLVMQRFVADGARDVVFMLHGSIENGRVFYSASGKGLAPYLAQHGFDVFVPDLRGRGASTPHVGRHSSYGQTEIIVEE